MTRFEKGYLVAFVDGEGHISAELTNSRLPTQGFGCRIVVNNTSLRGINYVKGLFEQVVGHPLKLKPKKQKGNRKDGWVLSINQQADVIRVIDILLPYLQIKREQAIILRDHLLWRQQQSNIDSNGRFGRFHNDVYKRDREVKALLNRLNTRGRPQLSPRVRTDYTETSHLSQGEDIVASPA